MAHQPIFPEGSYFDGLFQDDPDLVIIINAGRISVFKGNEMGLYPQIIPPGVLPVSHRLDMIADSIKDLM